MPADELKQAARIHRRWRGVGMALFVAFYSFFFAMHLKLEKSNLYLKDNSVLPTNTASFFNDLVLPREHAGAGGTGRGTAFLLLHHAPARLLVAAWKPFSDESAARKHALATLTASAGAMTVVLLYLTLMWSGMARLRAAVVAGILGGTTAMNVVAVLPLPQVFSTLGLMAVLAAVARGRSGRWWEFPLAAVYALCCSPWNAIPVALMGLVSGARAFRGGGGVRPVLGLLGSALMLALLVFGAVKMQAWLYPRTAMAWPDLVENWQQTFAQAVTQPTNGNAFQEEGRDLVSKMVHGPMIENVLRRLESPTGTWGLVPLWALMILLALIGLLGAIRHSPLPIVAALLTLGWYLWFYGTSFSSMERLLKYSLSTPFLVFLVGIGLEQHVKGWNWLRWPVTCLLTIFLVLLFLHNVPFIAGFAGPGRL